MSNRRESITSSKAPAGKVNKNRGRLTATWTKETVTGVGVKACYHPTGCGVEHGGPDVRPDAHSPYYCEGHGAEEAPSRRSRLIGTGEKLRSALKLLSTLGAAHVGDPGLRPVRMTARKPPRPTIPAFALAKPDQVCRKNIEHGCGLTGFRNASATMPGGLRAGLELSWIGGATFAQECNAASPCPTVTDSLVRIRFVVAEHAGVLIVEIDLTRIGPVSRTFPLGSDPARSAPLRVAARRTAQTMTAEKTDRSRTEFALCMPLSARVADSSGLQRRARRFWPISTWHRRTRRNKRRKLLRPRADGVPASDGRRERIRCPMDRPSWSDEAETQA
jgi:hypothetical protein